MKCSKCRKALGVSQYCYFCDRFEGPARKVKCEATQHSDQMVCFTCNLVWDMNDPHPPRCKKDFQFDKDNIRIKPGEIMHVPYPPPIDQKAIQKEINVLRIRLDRLAVLLGVK